MYKSTINQTSVTAILDTRVKKSDGTHPVRIRVTHRRITKYYNTGKLLSESDWNKLLTSRQPILVSVRTSIKNSFDLVVKVVEELEAKGEFSFQAVEIGLGRESAGTIDDGFRLKIEDLRDNNQIGNMIFYEGVLAGIQNYMGKNIPYENISVQWLKEFEDKQVKKGLSYATIGMRMRGIRTILKEALRMGKISAAQYPFERGKYTIKVAPGKKKALTMEQIAAVAKYDNGDPITLRYRDYWLFIYLCNGLNVADFVRLKFSNIVDGEIVFIREKTKRTSRNVIEIRATITRQMQDIIDHWGNKPLPDNYLFKAIKYYTDPVKHNKEVKDLVKRINKHMKIIGAELGIGTITTYTARHSFATVLKRSGVNIEYISESLGHSSITTTRAYLDSFEKKERQKNADLLTKFSDM